MEGQAVHRFSNFTGYVAIGVLLLGSRLWSQTYIEFSSKPNVGWSSESNSAAGTIAMQAAPSYAAAAVSIFSDDFNSGAIDLNKWRIGANAGNQSAVVSNALQLRSQDYESGWVVTRNAYPARNTTIAVKVIQPNNDGDLGMSPTYNLSSIYGIYNETNFYRFYTYRNTSSGAYRLYVEWKKNGALNGIDVTGNLVINGAVYLRLRGDDTKIHFDASLDGVTWSDTYNETFALPGYTLDTPFYYELAGYKTWSLGTFIVDDFSISSQSADTQPPQISAVAAQNVTSSSAQITWQTNEAADSQVEYGLTTSYGVSTSLDLTLITSHVVTLSGLSANTLYHYRVKSKDAAGNLAISSDFVFQTDLAGQSMVVLNDPLNNGTLGNRIGGQFVNGGGWQVTGVNDMIVYDLGRYVESGICEVRVRNFSPSAQNTYDRHHFLSMFRNPWGNHHPVENQETVWDLHAGFNYDPGVKMLSWTYVANEIETRVLDSWNLSQTYQIKVIWNDNQLQYFRDGVLYATHTHTDAMQLRYLYIGRDLTVSADLVTNFQNNQYPAVIGPIYSNIVVTETVSATDQTPSQVGNIAASDIYVNGARLAWTTDEPAVCYVEYGPTNAYGQKTAVLGPPAQTFSTTLASLTSSQTYHYRIVALDNAGNLTTTVDQTFTTLQNGTYIFKPIADTYVEQAGLYGTTRDYGNFGWMNLLGGAGRESYLRFNVAGVDGNVTQSALRLHGRQSGNSGGTLRVLNTSWNESTVTWRTKPSVTGQQLGAINSVQAGQWHEINVGGAVSGNGAYNFALVGTGVNVVSFDSRESTNSQPELLVTSNPVNASTVTLISPNGGEWWFVNDTKPIQWSGSSSIANVKLEFSQDAGASWSTIVMSTPNTGVYNWIVPNAVSNFCLIRVADATNAAITDVSDGKFFVTHGALINFTPSPGNPVLRPGSSGSWDENIRERGWFLYENGTYHVWYGGWQGAYNHSAPQLVQLGYASSTDGVNWTKYSGNPIYVQNWMEDVAVVKDGNTYYMYAEDEYTGDGDGAFIDLYTSTNKINWTRYGTVIRPTGNGWEANDVGTPTVWKEGNTWYMLYEGLGNGIAGQVGLATSSDGRSWTRHPNNPVLSHPFSASLDIAVDSIIKINGVYYAYSHYDAGGHNWVAGMFTSTDLIVWTAYPGNPLPYNSPVLVDNGVNYFMYSLIPGTNGLAPYNLATSTHPTPPVDNTPPIITAVAASGVTSTAATITWQTDEAADSQVEYGLTASYGSSSPLDPARVTSHSVMLSSLQMNTTYHYRVKSRDAANNLAASGDFVFTTLPSAPTLTLTSPNGGESWTIGSAQTITWNSTGILPNVKLEISVDNGANWTTIVSSTANDGSESWTIPDNASNQCLVRVSDAADGDPVDVSDAVFAILALPPPTLTLTSPNGGESWMVGAVQNITWNSTGTLPNVKLEFSVDNGANWTTIVASTANGGSESWTIPDNVSTQCLVRASDAADGDPVDVSDAVFAIIAPPPPTLTLISPNGGESWTVGSTQAITWNSTGTLQNVKLEFSIDNGVNWTTIVASTANDGNEAWTIPNNASNTCLVRVSDAADGDPVDVSDAVFAIIAPLLPTITGFTPISGPVGTEVTIVGTNFTGATSVAFNGMNATSFTVDSDTQIQSAVPFGATTGKISVTTPAGPGVSVNDFVVAATLTFNPSDDAYVRSDQASSNFGSATTLRMKQSSPVYNSYLKFVVSGVTAGTVQSAKLRIKVTVASSSGGSVYTVSNNYRGTSTAWLQSGLNYNNAPAISGTPLSTIGSVTVGQVVEFDVKSAITGNGTFSFGLKNSSSTTVQYSSKEGATKPELVIQTGLVIPTVSISDVTVTEGNIPQGGMNAVFTVSLSEATSQVVMVAFATANGTAIAGSDYMSSSGVVTFPAGTTTQLIMIPVIGDAITESNETFFINLSNPTNATLVDAQGQGTITDDDMITITLNPTDDVYVRSDQAASNFGTATTLRMKQSSPVYNSYLKFLVSGINGPVLSAKLRMKVAVASSSGGSVYTVSNNYRGTSTVWLQNGLNYNNAPSISGTALSTIGSVTVNQVVEFDVTSAINGNGTFSFGLRNSSSTTVQYSSNEGATRPELVIQFGISTASKMADLKPESIESKSEEIAAPLPERFVLLPNYPNPFNVETRIVYQLPERSHVKLTLHDLMGREVKILANEEREAGTHQVEWDGRDVRGNPLPSGIYIYSLQAGSFRSSKKLLLVK
jgi:hypothetical protein